VDTFDDDLDEELLYVARSLCAVAATFLLLGAPDKAARQLEQACHLLEERGRLARLRRCLGRLELQ
jgi:hypothetical protein